MDCPHIPELGYGEFSKRLHEKVVGQRVPVVGSLELTFRCNLRCAHCYVVHGHTGIPGQQELTTDEFRNIFDQLADEECLWLLLTGGEPLVRPGALDIYTYAKRKGFLVTLFTNGTLLTPRIADTLAEWRPFSIEISLYGRTQETYERITGVPGSHARCLRGIDLLLERGLPLKLKTPLMTLNRHELRDVQVYAESLGVEFRFDPIIFAELDGGGGPTAFRLSPEEIVQSDLNDPKRLAGWLDYSERYRGARADPRYLYTCSAGRRTFHIDPYGRLSVCMMSRARQYDLRRGTFRQGWYDYLPQVREQPPTGDYGCNQCQLLPLCDQCPGLAQMEHGDQEKRIEFLCRVTHLRAKAFGFHAQPDEEESG